MTAHENPGLLKEFMEILTAKQQKGMLFLLLGSIVGAVVDTVSVGAMLPFMNAVMDIDTIADSRWRSVVYQLFRCENSDDLLIALAAILACLFLFRGVYKFWFQWVQQRVLASYRTNLSTRIFSNIMHKPYQYHLRHSSSETLRTVTEDVDQTFSLLNTMMLLVAALMTSAGILILLLSVDVRITVGAVALMMFLALSVNKGIKKMVKQFGAKNIHATTKMYRWVQQAIGGMKGILVNRRQEYFIDSYTESASVVAKTAADYTAIAGLPKYFIEAVSMAGIFAFMGILVATKAQLAPGKGSLGQMLPTFATFALAATRLIPIITQITDASNQITYRRPRVDAVYRGLKTELAEVSGSTDAPATKKAQESFAIQPLREGVFVDGVTFRFADATAPLFDQVSLRIPAGKSVAFVGTTGSGKTTMADILLGLQIPCGGCVKADGRDILEEPDWWAGMVGYVPQFIYLCDDTIRNNIAFGYKAEDIDEAWVWKCLEDAQMKSFVESLPQGLDTVTGENGIRLSGGQRQRVGIARALYSNPQFLVLDEATSALDNDTEQAIIESVNHLAGKITLLIIAHRLTTIQDCDYVYRIENGEVRLEKGNIIERGWRNNE